MKNLFLYVLLIAIYNSFLFYGFKFGINVILFIIPLSIYLIYILKSNNKIKNKKGLLFLIPIYLLSISYFIYDNSFFKYLNVFIIPLLFLLMYIYTINPTFKILEVLEDIGSLLFEPLNFLEKYYKDLIEKLNNIFRLEDNTKKRIKSILIIIPVIVVVLVLLSSADQMFNNLFSKIIEIFNNISLNDLLYRIALIIIIFTYVGIVIYYLINSYGNRKEKDIKFEIDTFTIKALLTSLNVIYIVFDIIQIRSLMFHKVASNINYAEYARSGFFQLLFISIINLVILLISKRSKEDTKYNKISSIIMIFLTLIIIISSFFRMNMYESVYGYTLLRLLVYVSLITEVILLVPTIFYIINSKTNIFKYYMIIIITIYTIVSLSPVDYIIAKRNINKYYKDNSLDLSYLKNGSCDNVGLLVDLYNKTEDQNIIDELNYYFKYDVHIKGFQDYNLSRVKARKLIRKLKEEKNIKIMT